MVRVEVLAVEKERTPYEIKYFYNLFKVSESLKMNLHRWVVCDKGYGSFATKGWKGVEAHLLGCE